MPETPVVLITGGSSGIGKATAAILAQRGCRIYEISRRNVQHNDGIVHLQADLTDFTSLQNAINQFHESCKRLDVLINNAGMGVAGSAECMNMENIRRQFEVNFFGAVRLSQLVLPDLRASRGRIINVSSAAAIFPTPYQSYYSASKAALLNWSRALNCELRQFGVQVATLCPGDIPTGFTAARIVDGDNIYGDSMAKAVTRMESDEQHGGSIETVVHAIENAVFAKKLPPVIIPGLQFKIYTMLANIMPASVVDFLVGKHFS